MSTAKTNSSGICSYNQGQKTIKSAEMREMPPYIITLTQVIITEITVIYKFYLDIIPARFYNY